MIEVSNEIADTTEAATPKPYLNLGCGRIILPMRPGTFFEAQAEGKVHALPSGFGRPVHHQLIDASVYSCERWLNVDRNNEPGVDEVVDLFAYPWPWADNSFDGALLSHIVEHIPHEIRMTDEPHQDLKRENFDYLHIARLLRCQDGWYAFFAELYRVLTPGAVAHILSPYGWSQGAITDPTHTRLVTEHTFSHSIQPDPNSPFYYETGGIHFEHVEPAKFSIQPMFAHLAIEPGDNEAERERKARKFEKAMMTRINVIVDIAVKLRVVKP